MRSSICQINTMIISPRRNSINLFSQFSRQLWTAGQSYKVLLVTAIATSRCCQVELIWIIIKCLRTNCTFFFLHLAILDRTRSFFFQHPSTQYHYSIKRVAYLRVCIYSTNSLNFAGESEVGFGFKNTLKYWSTPTKLLANLTIVNLAIYWQYLVSFEL